MVEDKDKSKEELIQELADLRRRMSELVRAGETEYRKIEEELKKSEKIYRTIFEISPDYIYLNDAEGYFLDGNAATLQIHGLSLEEFRKKNFLDFFAGDNLPELIRVADGLREGRPVFGLRLKTRSALGQILELEINAVPLLENGKVVSVLSMARDITDRVSAEVKLKQAYDEMESRIAQRTVELFKANQGLRAENAERQRAEEELRASEEKYRLTVKNIPVLVAAIDRTGYFFLWNKYAENMLGYTAEEAVGKIRPVDIHETKEDADEVIRVAGETGLYSKEIRFRHKNKTLVPSHLVVVPNRDSSGKIMGFYGFAEDITERKKAEESLRESEEMYRTLVETSPDPVTVMDLGGKIIFASEKTFETFGYVNEEEFLGKNIMDLIDPSERERVISNFRDSVRKGSAFGNEYKIRKKDGTLITIESRSSILRDASGKPKALMGVTRDITERKRTEAALQESEEMYRTLIEASPDVITLLDMEGRITFATEKIYEMYGYKNKEEFMGKKVVEFFSSEDRKRVIANLQKSAKLGSLSGNEYPIVRKDGKLVVTEVSSALIRDAQGRPKAMIAINRDVTARKQAEAALRESEERYRTLVETSPDADFVTDLEGRIREISQRALELLGASKKNDLIGKTAFDFAGLGEHTGMRQHIAKIQKANAIQNVERVISRIDGSTFIGEVSASVLRDAEGEPKELLVTIRDVSARKRLEKQILEISAREQRRIGHDLHDGLGQNLTAISFMNKVLENKLAAKSPAEAREAAKISKLISEAITQSRDLARGINPVEAKPEGLMASLRQLAVNLERLFKVSCVFQCPRRVLVDDIIVATNLYYIAQEATSNAIRHGKASQIKIRLAVVRNKLTLNVSDDGVGIPKGFRPNGGLGMQIMDYRSKQIGANLSIQPGRKKGTMVSCSLLAPGKTLH